MAIGTANTIKSMIKSFFNPRRFASFVAKNSPIITPVIIMTQYQWTVKGPISRNTGSNVEVLFVKSTTSFLLNYLFISHAQFNYYHLLEMICQFNTII